MKIAYMSVSPLGTGTANCAQVAGMCNAFAELGHEVDLFACHAGYSEPEIRDWYQLNSGIRLFLLPGCWFPGCGTLLYGWKVRQAFSRHCNPDLVYGRHLLSLYLLRNQGLPIIYESHRPENKLASFFFKQLVRSPDFRKLVVVSRALKDEYVRAFGNLLEGKILVAPNGSDDCHLVDDTELPQGGSGDRPVFGYTGGIDRRKGLQIIIELAKRIPEAEFQVIGASREEAESNYGNVGHDNLHFLGYQNPASIPGYIQAFHGALAPYQPAGYRQRRKRDDTDWGSPLKIFEYMACGTPIIASDIPMVRELLVDDESALLCEPDNLDEWERAARRILSDSSLKKRLGDNARAQHQQHYRRLARARKVLGGRDTNQISDG
ncbi:MAG: glycosyltransferase family 4 protein [Gammaproteobacteria bacterium]|nr:glycosyltransferase family 4 protein [Gammaproteobacteria bacterium]